MRLRKHQAEFSSIIDAIINRQNTPGVIQDVSKLRTIILRVTPGGGKSFIPIVAGKLIEAGKADALCWIVPRQSLQDQGEREFLDPLSRELFKHNLVIRSSTNEVNPCRGTDGFVTTYQAIGVDDRRTVAEDFARKRYILILDEYHHVEKDGIWHKALKELENKAAYVILMTGTLERGDGKEIAFTRYIDDQPLLKNTEDTAVIEYSRQDALIEQAILPISFHLSDGHFEWEEQTGFRKTVNSFLNMKKGDRAAALYTALNTEFAIQLLRESVTHWQQSKITNPRAKLLVITADYKSAKEITSILQDEMGVRADIATSHSSKEALAAIKRFKGGTLDALVTIAMAYEGLSVPQVTHIACLTLIRSTPWIEQAVARAVRIDRGAGPYSTQRAYIFAPSDHSFVEIVKRIETEQVAALKNNASSESNKVDRVLRLLCGGEGQGNKPPIVPIESGLTGTSEHFVGVGIDHRQELSIPTINLETLKEQETRIRQEISKHINRFCFEQRYEHQRINAELKKKFGGVSRELLSLAELKKLQIYIKNMYPIDYQPTPNPPPAGVKISLSRAKRQRVPTKATPWTGSKEYLKQQLAISNEIRKTENEQIFHKFYSINFNNQIIEGELF